MLLHWSWSCNYDIGFTFTNNLILNRCLGNALPNLGRRGLNGDIVYDFLTNCLKKAGKNCMNSYQKIGTLFEIKNGVVLAAIDIHGTLIDRRRYDPFVNSYTKNYCKI